jgi:2-(1,2-epoxy-1,2-dihydrophenyl)acetyl-CoA isomerase
VRQSEFFEIVIDSGVARCTMKGPKMNALGEELLFPMCEMMADVLADEDVRVIVLRGGEGDFCSGGDVGTMGEKMDPLFLNANMRLINNICYQLHEGPKVVITEVDGWAVGGGMGWAMASDMTYASERARFMMSFIRISIIPDLGSTYFLPLRVGLLKAKELVFTGRPVGAEEALQMGVVNRVIPHEEIGEETMKVARKIATRPARVLALMKRHLNIAPHTDLRTILDLEENIQPFMVQTPEHAKDVADFFKKKG